MYGKISIGKKLKISRITLGMTIRDIAEGCCVNRNVIYRLEAAELENNALMKYLKFLHKKGIDLNKFFENGE